MVSKKNLAFTSLTLKTSAPKSSSSHALKLSPPCLPSSPKLSFTTEKHVFPSTEPASPKPSSGAFRPNSPDNRSLRSVNRANELYSKKEYKSAIEEYTKALSLCQPNSDPGRTSDFLALIYSNRSASYHQCQKWEDAVKDAEQVIRISPDWPKGYFRKAEALVQLGRIEEALDNYCIAKLKDPRNPQVPLRIAKALALADNNSMGLTIYELVPGKDICIPKAINPIQKKVFDFAVKMKNLIYIVVDNETRNCIVIDACWDIDGILKFIKNKRLELVGAIVTHYHFDHVGGILPPPYDHIPMKISGLFNLLKRRPKVKAYIHPKDIPYVLKANPGMAEMMPMDKSSHVGSEDESFSTASAANFLNSIRSNRNAQPSSTIERLCSAVISSITPQGLPTCFSHSSISNSTPGPLNDIPSCIPAHQNLTPEQASPSSTSTHIPLSLSSLFSLSSSSNEPRIVPTPHDFVLTLGSLTLIRFLHTPGHTEGSQSILVNECRLFTGDTLMCGCVGRMDLPGGDPKEMGKTLKERLGNLDDGIVVYPGHDYGGEWTTIGIERNKGVIGRFQR
ncbi:12795_t:CDS:2 [Acaulospora morrowiae]|uniref:12795_t:CDS:1 n=1 Tax=Acaulospora morrowiae TaxID=94023 RepID=A0A9N9A1Q8_9GLOM|nr:12795_t:CDS:2 [Acaulospora morrowiae]